MMESLSGAYFNYALGFYPGLIRKPLIIRLNPNGNSRVVSETLEFKIEGPLQILRVIIEGESLEGKVNSRHSNLLLLDNLKKEIVHFEPMLNPYHITINKILIDTLRPSFRGYNYTESNYHPQKKDNDKYCVAFTILFAMDYILGSQQSKMYQDNIAEYANAIKKVYPLSLEEQMRDVEYGFGAGLALGALGGLAIAGAVGAAASPRTVYINQPYPYAPYRYY